MAMIRSQDNPFSKNVLLIVHDVYQDFNMFPLGFGYLAGMLRKYGYSVEIFCMDVFHWTNDQLEKKLLNGEYDIIGTGFMAARFEETIVGLCESINKHKKDAWLFLGGPGPTPIPEYTLKRTKADIIMMGDAEETIIEVLDAKLTGKNLKPVAGIVYREGEEIFVNPRRTLNRDLDSLPFPAWDLFPMKSYTQSMTPPGMHKPQVMMDILASRGCTDTCNFCYRLEKGIRFRSLQNVIDEIKYLKEKYGATYFVFVDELFVFPKLRIFEFERLLKENNLEIEFCCQSRADLFTDDVVESLMRSGCKFVNIGFESVDENVLNYMGKRMTVEQNMKALDVANRHKIGLGINFLWGQAVDTPETIRKNI